MDKTSDYYGKYLNELMETVIMLIYNYTIYIYIEILDSLMDSWASWENHRQFFWEMIGKKCLNNDP
jgi:hypothetical protein